MSKVMMAPRRLAHFNLYVSDLRRSTEFYHSVCGIHYIAGEPDIPINFFTNGSSHHELGLIELHEGDRVGRDGFVQGTTRKGQKPGLNHLGWEMPNEAVLVDAYRRLEGKPLKYHTADHTIAHSVYVADVDNNMHEFFADTTYDWPNRLKGNVERLTGRWDPLAEHGSEIAHHERGLEEIPVPDAAVRPMRISHGVLRVRDFDEMREWLRDVAGLEECAVSLDDRRAAFRGIDSPMPFDLIVQESAEGDALARMAFRLPNMLELVEARERLHERGLQPLGSFDSDRHRGFVLTDPDGIEIEFYAVDHVRSVEPLSMLDR